MTNEELLTAIRDGKDRDSRLLMELWDQNKGMVEKACRKYAGRIEHDDARQECFISFAGAVKDYDPAGGPAFANYLYKRCVWHLTRYWENCGQAIRIPVYRQRELCRYRRFIRQWYQTKGERPADTVICFNLNITRDQLETLRADLQAADLRSIDEPLTGEPDGDTVADTVPDRTADTEAGALYPVYDQERRRTVWAAVDSLNPRESEAIRHYYQDGRTYEQAGQLMGVSRERVRTLIAAGFRRLRTRKQYRILQDFADLSRTYSMGIQTGTPWESATEKTALYLMEMEQQYQQEREELERILAPYRQGRPDNEQ